MLGEALVPGVTKVNLSKVLLGEGSRPCWALCRRRSSCKTLPSNKEGSEVLCGPGKGGIKAENWHFDSPWCWLFSVALR